MHLLETSKLEGQVVPCGAHLQIPLVSQNAKKHQQTDGDGGTRGFAHCVTTSSGNKAFNIQKNERKYSQVEFQQVNKETFVTRHAFEACEVVL